MLTKCFEKGEPFTTDQMYKDSLEKAANDFEGVKIYTENCLMNSQFNVDKVCKNQKVSGITQKQIEKVQKEKCKNGKPPKISSEIELSICLDFKLNLSTDDIFNSLQKTINGLTRKDIEEYKTFKCKSISLEEADENDNDETEL